MADEAPPLLPELARSLRILGTLRDDAAAESAHKAVFGPLLDARARASRSDANGAVAALRGAALSARIVAQANTVIAAGISEPARVRARQAAAKELLQPLLAALTELDRLGPHAEGEWLRWVDQLRVVFSAADDACGALARLLSDEGEPSPPRRWFGRSSEEDGR